MSDNEKPIYDKDAAHVVIEIKNKTTGARRYAVAKIRDNGRYRPRHDDATEIATVVGTHPHYDDAQNQRMKLGREIGQYKFTGESAAKKAVALPPFMEFLPTNPRERRALFLDLDADQQEEIFYSMILATGMPRHRIAQWFLVGVDEISHIEEAITQAARAELDLRIAKKMVHHALSNNQPASMTAVLYLTKVFLGWNEMGMAEANPDPMTNIGAAQTLFNDLQVIETHRNENGETTAPSTVYPLVRKTKAA